MVEADQRLVNKLMVNHKNWHWQLIANCIIFKSFNAANLPGLLVTARGSLTGQSFLNGSVHTWVGNFSTKIYFDFEMLFKLDHFDDIFGLFLSIKICQLSLKY